jgi:hypothetical protein
MRALWLAILGPMRIEDDLLRHIRSKGQPRDLALADLARQQHGVVAVRQLLALGFSRSAIRRRLQSGRLHRLHTGVYAVGHRALRGEAGWMAAVLASGPGAVLSHRSAAALWGIRETSHAVIDVTARSWGRRRRSAMTLHQVSELPLQDTTRRRSIPVTTLARTILDLAGILDLAEMRRVWEAAEREGRMDRLARERVRSQCPGRRGARSLNTLLGEAQPAPPVRSELERLFLDLCADARLPVPDVNERVAGFEVDMSWIDERLIVELDGYDVHRTRAAFERDRVRDAKLALHGFRVLRFTDRRLKSAPTEVALTVRALLDTPTSA